MEINKIHETVSVDRWYEAWLKNAEEEIGDSWLSEETFWRRKIKKCPSCKIVGLIKIFPGKFTVGVVDAFIFKCLRQDAIHVAIALKDKEGMTEFNKIKLASKASETYREEIEKLLGLGIC